MDTVQRLVGMVMRAFYSSDHCIVVDLLMSVNSIKGSYILKMFIQIDDELALALNCKVKDAQFICGKLKAHGLIRVESQQEELGKQDGFITMGPDSAAAKRKVSKSYYFLDYKQFIDVVKWKMHKINQMYGVVCMMIGSNRQSLIKRRIIHMHARYVKRLFRVLM
jgi:transcription initiation factor TFIIE subunit alpha